ncbi:hypothetical protein HYPSUDRAFT_204398 [Hypholoma sublateritium FD-334 SS-4]|uniref:Uncharacterized protein n=1 Tax=Hypholoma sublateritium (strain FD-334 SS-4) TaxID=945553 RepID=A0A0D2M8N5_HYPSF|nr:hypothetical protein HYPSUDRAFT_204398 [Hypholoma sublateritium FD-334 SS-4]
MPLMQHSRAPLTFVDGFMPAIPANLTVRVDVLPGHSRAPGGCTPRAQYLSVSLKFGDITSSSTFGARSSDEFANCSSQIRHCCYVCHALTRIWTALTPCFCRSSLLAVPLPLPPPPPARHSRLDAQPDKNGHAVRWASPMHVSHVAVSFGRVDWAHCPVSVLVLVPTLRRPISNVPTPSTPTSPYRAVTMTTASPSLPSWTDLAPPTTNLRPPSSPPSSPKPTRLVTPEPPWIRTCSIGHHIASGGTNERTLARSSFDARAGALSGPSTPQNGA